MLVYQSVESASLLYGGSCALIYGEHSLTYKQLMDKVDNLSKAILDQAYQESYIGISATRSLEMIIGVLAILKARKAYVPLDTKYPKIRLEQLIQDASICFCISKEVESSLFQDLGLISIVSDKSYDLPNRLVPFINPAVCVLYTSGSTGVPKGVCLPQQGLLNQINWQIKNGFAKPGVKTLQYCHLSFDAAFQEIFVPLSTGGTLHIVDDDHRLNAGNLLKYINKYQISRLFLPYAMVQMLAETAANYELYPTALKEIITGGELLRITPQIAHFFGVLKDTTLMNVYGPTEASVWVTELKLKGDAFHWPAIPSLGKPIANIRLYLVDARLNEVGEGSPGEILIEGECLALEYLNKPKETAEKFINWVHPFKGALRVYRTGDLASLNPDGSLQFLGRMDGQVKIRGGNRVELGEIEVVISKINGVGQVEVMVREDYTYQKRIVAYIIPTDKYLTIEQIKEAVKNHLPDYMIPAAFVLMDVFPYTVSGKVDRNALPFPEITSTQVDQFVAPSSEMELYLTGLWQDLLRLDNLGVKDDFFELGGNSLLAIQMIVRIEKDKDKQLPLVSVFENATIEKLSKLIQGNLTPEAYHTLVALKASGSRPPLYLIHGDSLNVLSFVGLTKHIHPDQPVYGLQPKGMDGKSDPIDSIEAIAAYYNKAIIAKFPEGPYAIAGYSFGGYVAVEMAKQMKAEGRPVFMIGLFDTNVINAENYLTWSKQLRRKLLRQFPKFKWIVQSILQNPAKALGYQFTSLKNRLRSFFNMGSKAVLPEVSGYLKMMDKINAVHHQALLHYNLAPFQDKVVLFKAQDRVYFVDDFDFLGWRKYALAGVEVHNIPGNHDTMFKEPNCQILALALDKAILLAIHNATKNSN
jgi:amino acid adenylation domain-containing protein